MGEGMTLRAARRRRTAVLVGALGLGAVLLALLGYGLRPASSVGLKGHAAPPFSLPVFSGMRAGETLTLESLAGEVVVLHVWASWCVECRPEMLVLERVWDDYRSRGVAVVGVDYLDTDAAGLAYLAELAVSFPNGPDVGSKIFQSYRCSGVPETFVFDEKGIVRDVHIGVISEAELRSLLDTLTSGKKVK